MKARNSREREITALYEAKASKFTKAQTEWIEKSVVSKRIFTSGKRCWCTECGGEWDDAKVRDAGEAVCPHCGARLEVEISRKTTFSDFDYVQIFQVVSGWQVIRYVLVRWYGRKGIEKKVTMSDVIQRWCQPGKPMLTLGAPLGMSMGWREIPYSYWDTRLTVKDGHGYWYQEWMKVKRYPRVSLLPVYERNLGKRPDFSKWDAPTLLGDIFGCPYLEALWKDGRKQEVKVLLRHIDDLNKYWPSVRVAVRHGYRPTDWYSYFEYLKALRFTGHDMRSPRYVAPKDWVEIHDLVMRQYRNRMEIMSRRREEAQRMRMALQEEQRRIRREKDAKDCAESFAKHIAPFLDLRIESARICITPLTSIEAFREEGDAMRHCVFNMGYYGKPDSLILSARTKADNKRCETIEIDMKNWIVRQSLGFADTPTDKHDEILGLLDKEMPRIKMMAV